ncbi:Glucosamine-6-phosphate isomerase (Glucosamine-6-phosphate deaminase) (GNPDA) (GlcN6P deaminase) [Mycoemilia scoparia]|uniref:Beta-hexosaminidase n=1 Tax=Mycoemilia scoparia TaxID=417184 RepID=A0A9W7ZYZ7_9FUNG|nr:Glucosamine-6-phosphate isomerase (Glucosamine-6-phosphate deaminase) (GNPDA) (GlcN6P deaminase) [Mycoemilia scoparia]
MKVSLSVLGVAALLAQTVMAVWPIPKEMSQSNQNTVAPNAIVLGKGCGNNKILRSIVQRYSHLVSKESFLPPHLYNDKQTVQTSGALSHLTVNVKDTKTSSLGVDTDESYDLNIPANGEATLNANTVYGALRGLETYSQLITSNGKNAKVIRNTPISIKDSPRFPHRGILLDTARNFYPLDSIKRTIDAMSYNKLNVLHWHVVDAQSWPIESKLHPELADKGAYAPNMRYSYNEVKHLIEYAMERGVRIIPEFDMPGHTYIIGLSHPEIMSCLNMQPDWDHFAAEPPSGQFDITNPEAAKMAKDIINEYSKLFPDKYFNIGGDEVNINCWNESKKVQDYLAAHPGQNVTTVLQRFYDEIHKQVVADGKSAMCWEETLFHQNYLPPKGTIVQTWIDAESVHKTVAAGYHAVASPWTSNYLDCGHGAWLSNSNGTSWCDPYKNWVNVYQYDPLTNVTKPEEQALVLGGEVTLWSEQSDQYSLDTYLWPRSSAHAEIMWSGPTDPKTGKHREPLDAITRLHGQRYRMLDRGIESVPLQPLWCARNPGNCSVPPPAKKAPAAEAGH